MSPESRPPEIAHAPHPPLTRYFADEAARRAWVRGIFNRTAADYTRVERLMALGSGARYRRHALARGGLVRGMQLVDVGAGTGLVTREAVALLGAPQAVIGVDPSPAMLANAVLPAGVRLLEGSAERIPLPDASVDFVSMGYALRHVSDLAVAFREFFRVLRPSGIVLILEVTRPAGRIGNALLKAYMRGVVPAIARVAARSSEMPLLMRYYWDTIEACVPPASVASTLAHAGFRNVGRTVTLGIFSEYRGTKPRAD
ncbi:MAG: class I SAM-dependent methyltransferase [Burkholderiales bacterium]|nr:class I SAM-dependent methyltransferase [Burkholderiales bacterium]